MPYTIPIAKSTDREVVEAFIEISTEFDFPNPRIELFGDDGFVTVEKRPADIIDGDVKAILELNAAVLQRCTLQSGQQHLLRVHRPDNQVFDTLTITWSRDSGLPPQKFATMVAAAKIKLREVKLNHGASTLRLGGLDELVNARSAELNKLEAIASDIVRKSHERFGELEQEHIARRVALENEFAERKRKGQEEIDKLKADAEAAAALRIDALEAREKELDKSEAKYARRQLRLDLLKILQAHSDRFQLSTSTRRLRWPTFALLVAVVAATGFLTYISFVELATVISGDQTPWWRVAIVSAKQVFFAATFLGLAAYFLRWLESWSRRHADAEFYFKQLELDLNRASWVVEIAAEWREKEGAELPKELLAQLANHLFTESGFAGDSADGESVLASILGGATTLKLDTPGGGKLEIGRTGIKKMLS